MLIFKKKLRCVVQALVDKFENDQKFRDQVSLVFGTLVSIAIQVIRKR